MWRYDPGRTAASPHALPAELTLCWTRSFGTRQQVWDDPLNNDLMPYDRVFEPIVIGDRVLVGFNDSDKVICWDARSGVEQWRFYTEGPVRLPPAGMNDRVFFASDDGHLYCLRVEDGTLLWKFRGGPSPHHVLGNRRLISMWPARGGPVVRDETVYFAAGIWPWMGTFVYALDGITGTVRWVNDDSALRYIEQPHSAAAFGGVAPQGALAATDSYLVVPGGRSIPAVFHRHNGELAHFLLNAAGKGTGGATVMAHANDLYVHTRQRGVRRLTLDTGVKTEIMVNNPVLTDSGMYTFDARTVHAVDSEKNIVWSVPLDEPRELIRAGNRLYVATAKRIVVLQLDDQATTTPQIVQTLPLPNVERLVAGSGMLIAVTSDGRIHAYSGQPVTTPADFRASDPTPGSARLSWMNFLAAHDSLDGYAIVLGVDETGELLDSLVASSRLQIVVVTEDERGAAAIRRRFDDRSLYGTRVAVAHGTIDSFHLPPYIAQVVILANEPLTARLTPEQWQKVYDSVRPYGGILVSPFPQDLQATIRRIQDCKLPRAAVSVESMPISPGFQGVPDGVVVRRVGPLDQSAPWTHLYGNVANTVKSDDQRVRAPLGILWFGGNSHDDVLPRHSHSPCEQVIGGRLFVEGVNSISARDVYTGRPLWKREFSDLGTFGVYYDDSYKETPLDLAYNQLHIPGANARGTNYVATSDAVYVAIGSQCEVIDPSNGQTLRVFSMPRLAGQAEPPRWTYLGVYGDLLFGGAGLADYRGRHGFVFDASERRGASWNPELFGCRELVAFDRKTGDVRWRTAASYSFLHNGIVAGNQKVFLLDRLPKSVEEQRARRGQGTPTDYRIIALDAESGKLAWTRSKDVFGTWLGLSEATDILVQSGAASKDRLPDETERGVLTMHASNGRTIWHNPDVVTAGPPILYNERLIGNSMAGKNSSGMFELRTGKPVLVPNPITGQPQPWSYVRQYGCNTAVASEHLLTFRSGAASFYDLTTQCGVGNLGGFRSGCSSNLIAADGVLNAPDFTRTCSCGYQNQTSLAMVHMPEMETWTINTFAAPGNIARLGINLGAPGTRKSSDGTLWIEFPSAAAGAPLPLQLQVRGTNPRYWRRHSSVADGEYAWVIASGIECSGELVLTLSTESIDPHAEYTVRCYFPVRSETTSPPSFSVQGTHSRLLPAPPPPSASGRWIAARCEISGIRPSGGQIELSFPKTADDQPVMLSGVELICQAK